MIVALTAKTLQLECHLVIGEYSDELEFEIFINGSVMIPHPDTGTMCVAGLRNNHDYKDRSYNGHATNATLKLKYVGTDDNPWRVNTFVIGNPYETVSDSASIPEGSDGSGMGVIILRDRDSDIYEYACNAADTAVMKILTDNNIAKQIIESAPGSLMDCIGTRAQTLAKYRPETSGGKRYIETVELFDRLAKMFPDTEMQEDIAEIREYYELP